ncbi:glycosyltransferase family 39 protein [Geotalea uraniireducens]|uniref:Glycosyl transferase, family 39 n=1 Tax=Geotalea uraniireducens (strain Rf4) TaxID=351605 RepID=A5G7S9_GEOUR|nr:glycosyltransferase family 39 protein [Geotalea uraniireducens]ABQ27847.1 glycosyl transferase, family 39 [Geotalea uraniireducens Rf4]
MKFFTAFLTKKEGSPATDLGVLLTLFGIAFFQFLGRLPLIETDEGRYMEIPREMLESGDFITPTLNYVKYFEKPPLHYWLNALSIKVFGQTEFAARFGSALWGILGIILTYHLGRKLFGRREGLISALILGTSVGYQVQNRLNITDTTLTICMAACLGFFLIAVQDEEKRKGLYYHLFYLFAALAVLAKGLIGIVLPGAVIFCYLLFTRRWAILKEMRLITGVPLFFLVAAPWFVLVSLRNPEFARFFFIHEHFERFLTKVHGRYQPPWFYIPILLGCMLPWSFFIPAAFIRVWKERKSTGADVRLYLALWAIVIFAFFSKSNSKLIPYILPIYPAIALLIGGTFVAALDKGFRPLKRHAVTASLVLCILGAGVIAYPQIAAKPAITAAGGAIIGLILLCQGIPALIATARAQTAALLSALLIFAYIFGIFGPPVIYAKIAAKKSSRELAMIIREKAGKDALVATFEYEQGLPFYTKRRVIVVGGRGELEFGSRQGDQSAWFIELEQFKRLWDSPTPVFALIQQREVEPLQKALATPMKVLGREGRRILVTNH